MAWVRLDDHMDEHDKVLALEADGPEAMWMLARALMLCNRKETDGYMPAAALARIGSDHGPAKRRRLVARLVEVGFLHEPGHRCPSCPQPPDGWQVHDYPDYQPTRAKLEADREQRRAAGRKGGLAKGKRLAKRPASDSLSETEAGDLAKSKPVPVPVPKEQPPSPSGRSPQRATRLDPDWRPEPEHDLVAAAGGQTVARREWAKFCDYWAAKPGKDGRKLDWQATWRNWLRRAAEDRAPPQANGTTTPVRGYDPVEAEARFRTLTGGKG